MGTIRDPLVVLDADLRVLATNRSFYKFFKVNTRETDWYLSYDLGNLQGDIPAIRNRRLTSLPKNQSLVYSYS